MHGNTPFEDSSVVSSAANANRIPQGLDRQLIVVSNRQPYSHNYDDSDDITVDRPTGGLTAGLDPVMRRTGGTWIAWGDGDADRAVVDGANRVAVPPDDPDYTLRRIWLSEDQVDDYYYGFSNQVLWPLCHGALTNVRCEGPYWHQYCRTNERFAEIVAEEAEDRPLVWFQDYHLALAPSMARQRLRDDATLMQFWHIPWPGWDTFRACPHGRALLDGLLGNDVLAFHVERYVENFLECVGAVLPDAAIDWNAREVHHEGSVTRVEAVPMGVPFDEIRRKAASRSAREFWSSFRREHDIDPETWIALGVDRLDYSKGIPERLRALERLLEIHPEWRGSLTYVQKASESRSKIPAYQRLQERVEDRVEHINHRFGTDDWQPIVYLTDHLSSEELYGLYRGSDLALVSPLRDGMNLVSQEYVAAQVDGDGVLVLSDQTGAHDRFGEFTVSIRPANTEGFAQAIVEALTMSRRERCSRMRRLQRAVSDNDLQAWLRRNVRLAGTVPSATSPATSVEHDVQ